MSKIKDMSKFDRPREKLEKYGPWKLSDAELLAILFSAISDMFLNTPIPSPTR